MLLASIIAIFIASLSARFVISRDSERAPYLLAAFPAIVFIALLLNMGVAQAGSSLTQSLSWVPSLDANIDLRLDGLGLLFSLMITGIGTFIILYAAGYLPSEAAVRGRFYAYMMLFMASMLGLFFADNIVLFFILWELTSVSSYLLIGFNTEDPQARKKALQALLVTGSGGVALLAGLIILGNAAGSYSFSGIIDAGDTLLNNPLANAALPLILLGAFTKSAQFPFHFWLPNAMAAPTPVSAYLHSATMVKAGIFLLFKLYPIYGSHPLWMIALTVCGGITLLYGTITGLFQRDLKRILAFTTMAVLGLLVMLIGVGSDLAIKSALLFMLGHALYKATLFMTAGNIDHATGTRDARILGGLRSVMPLTAFAAGLAAFSKGGFPPLLGFLGKEYVYKASSGLDVLAPWITGVALIGNALLLALAFKAGIHPYWSRAPEKVKGGTWSRFLPRPPHEVSSLMTIGPIILAVTSLLFGLFPHAWSDRLIEPALSASLNQIAEVSISLWNGINLPFLLSLATLTAGLLVYSFRQFFWRRDDVGSEIARKDSEQIYYYLFQQFVSQSKRITLAIQNGSLRSYLWIILVAAGGFICFKLLKLGPVSYQLSFDNINIFHIALMIGMMVAIGCSALASKLIHALAGLGLVGYGIALLFAMNGAPDLAITQVIVETLGVALILFATLKLPAFKRYTPTKARVADMVLASLAGAIAFFLSLKATSLQLAPSISAQLADWSYTLAKGKNVVNVILVDFRALDTFGEIVVLGIAAIGIKICLPKRESTLGYMPAGFSSNILASGAKLLLPVCIIFSLLALYRGHNEPGGGFIGGLLCASGFSLYALAMGTKAATEKLKVEPIKWIPIGILIAIISGLAGPLMGLPFMSGLWLPDFELPLLGTVHLGTPLLFDVGVYFVVLGFATTTVFTFLDILNPSTSKSKRISSDLPALTTSK